MSGLTRRFGAVTAVAGADLRAGPGVFGLLGPNGAGKTSLLRMMATALPPTTGSLRLLGRDVVLVPAVLGLPVEFRPAREVVGVGLGDVVDTFSHLHTALAVSSLRLVNGAVIGAIVGAIAIVAYRRFRRTGET